MPARKIIRFLKYTCVGTVGLVLDMTVLVLLVEYADMATTPAAAIAFLVAVINNYIFHRIWTFHSHSKRVGRQIFAFFVISCSNMLITVGLMHFFVEWISIWYVIAKVITAIIVLVWSYILNSIWTFNGKK